MRRGALTTRAWAIAATIAALASITATGICGALSWICVFRALQLAPAVKVGPIDKLSMPLGIVLAVIFLRESPSKLNWLGIIMMAAGAYLAAHQAVKQ